MGVRIDKIISKVYACFNINFTVLQAGREREIVMLMKGKKLVGKRKPFSTQGPLLCVHRDKANVCPCALNYKLSQYICLLDPLTH